MTDEARSLLTLLGLMSGTGVVFVGVVLWVLWRSDKDD